MIDPRKLVSDIRFYAGKDLHLIADTSVRKDMTECLNAIESLLAERDALDNIATSYRADHRTAYPGGCFVTRGNKNFPQRGFRHYDSRCGVCKTFDAYKEKS